MVEFLFQPAARLGDLGEELFVFGQEVVHIARAVVGIVGVFEVEVIIAGLDLIERDAPCEFVLFAGLEAVCFVAPPCSLCLKLLYTNRFALIVALGAGRVRVLVVPDMLRLRSLGEEEKVGANAGVGIEELLCVGGTRRGGLP